MPRDFDVAVVGGGIVGGVVALTLARRSLRVVLIESAPLNKRWRRDESNIGGFDARVNALNPASVEVLRRLDIWERLDASRCFAFAEMKVWDGDGDGEIRFSAEEMALPQLGWIVEHGLLAAAVAAQAAAESEIEILDGVALEECRDIGERARLQLGDGEVVEAALVVGADGAASRLREADDFGWSQWDCRQTAIFATVRADKPHRGVARQRFLSSGPLALLPLGGDDEVAQYCNALIWSADNDLAQALLALDEAEFRRRLGEATENVVGEILEVGERRGVPLRQGHAKRYFRGRLALVGDAAHVLHPMAGQGVNLGLADAAALGEVLAGWDGAAPAARLRRYQLRRQPLNAAMLGAMRGFKHLFAAQAPEWVWLRGVGLRMVEAAPGLKHLLMRQALGG